MMRLRHLAACLLATLAASSSSAENPPALEGIHGQTEPAARVEVPSVQRGRIAEMLAKEGQPIKQGEVIARLDTTLQDSAVKLAEFKAASTVDIDAAKTALEYAKNDLDRYQSNPTVSPAELEAKKLEYAKAALSLKKAEESRKADQLALDHERIVLDRMVIKSPLDGYVHRLNKQSGEAIDENQPLVVIVQTEKVNANFFLPENYFGKIKSGDKVSVELATTPPLIRQAVVVAVDPFVDPAGHLFRVKMELDNADARIPVGIAASWHIDR